MEVKKLIEELEKVRETATYESEDKEATKRLKDIRQKVDFVLKELKKHDDIQ